MAENTKPNSVVDASFVLNYLFPDEKMPAGDNIFKNATKNNHHLISTTLLPYEVINGLKSAVLRKRHPENKAKILAKNFQNLPIKLVAPNISSCLSLALKHQLSVYDASYLQLAIEKNCPLLTLDKKLNQLT